MLEVYQAGSVLGQTESAVPQLTTQRRSYSQVGTHWT
jgi:hypothetical protein